MHFRRKLPSLTALVALEAAIRHRSFTAAARELGVTQAAVSRQIAAIEEDFGQPLFARRHRILDPTPACLVLGSALAEGFYKISDAVDVMRVNASDVVTIGTTVAISSLWLMPRLVEFRRAHPGIQIRLVSQNSYFALHTREVDVAVQFGIPPFNDAMVVASRRDLTFPICSPDYAAGHDLGSFPGGKWHLIETDVPERSRLDWAGWFSETGLKIGRLEPTLRFSHFTETIAAAQAGQGVALGWETLIRPQLDDGSLVRVGSIELVPEAAYHLVVPVNEKRSAPTEQVLAWLAAALRED